MGQAATLAHTYAEAKRRVKEDGSPRIVFQSEETGDPGICFLDDWEKRPAMDEALSFVWPGNKVEII